MGKSGSEKKPVTIKKYANQLLYNTSKRNYVTLVHLSKMAKDKICFVVYGAKFDDDITHQVLTYIIGEEEVKGSQNLLPIGLLRHLIIFYGDSLQSVVPSHLEHTMHFFAQNQDQMREYLREAIGKKIAIFGNFMKTFTPFYQAGNIQPMKLDHDLAKSMQLDADTKDERLEILRVQLAQMQKQLDGLTRFKYGDWGWVTCSIR
jgi:polyhydroxyalkanoate synthesis repressor PhaR